MTQLTHKRLTEYLTSWLEFRRQRTEIPGMVVALAIDGKTIYKHAFGYRDIESKQPMQANTIFRIASHSKTFTATALMQLQQQGRLRIDDCVADYVPWLKEHKDHRYQKVTIRQLMSHGAGIIRDGLDADYWGLHAPFPDEKAFKQQVMQANLVYDTNIKMKYSNFGYTILGLVVERASGTEYTSYINKNIITPLQLNSTSSDYSTDIDNRLATGYTRIEHTGKRLPIDSRVSTNAMASATGFYASADDLLTYFNAHFIGSDLLLNDESKKEMQRQQWKVQHSASDEAYSLGLEHLSFENQIYFGHGGGFPGTSSLTLCSTQDKLVCTVLVNSLDVPVAAICKAIFAAYKHFTDNPATTDDIRYNGRFMSMWSMAEIVALGSNIVVTNPASWTPFKLPSKVEIVDKDTLLIALENSFMSEGELIKYSRDINGNTLNIRYGMTMYPEKDYNNYIDSIDMINIKKEA